MKTRVQPHEVESIHDRRGRLRVFEEGGTLSFAPLRCFVISEVPEETTRGGHAVSCDEFVAILKGSCVAVVSNGSALVEYVLTEQSGGLYVPKHTWFRLEKFERNTIVAVFASEKFGDTTYSDQLPF
jgi:hypothetical protein